MRTSTLTLLFAVFVLAFSSTAFCAEAEAPSLKEASVVTEVLPRGESVTAVRLEYSEEIHCGSVSLPRSEQTQVFRVTTDRSLTNAYVNNSGKKDDVELYGKYVFIELGASARGQATFSTLSTANTTSRTRARSRLDGYAVSQISPITTRSGKVIAPSTVSATREICVGMDDYKTFAYKNEATGHTLYYHLYIPNGYESKGANLRSLPLVAHYPAGDYNLADWTGKYRGALFTHHDVLYWSDEESQAQNPAFVVTVGGPADPKWSTVEFSKSEMQQNYLKIIQKIMADYNVDASRIYCVSLAGGSPAMWNTVLANPGVFAAQISTSYDPYHAYGNLKSGEDNFGALLNTMPGWFFAAFSDPTGAGVLGPTDTRLKGERLRDIAVVMNGKGFNIDIAYGKEGELMWNGWLRGDRANRLADDQMARAKARRATHLVTIYMPGTVLTNPHGAWDATYSNAAVRNWLFQQVNDAPYVPGK